MADKQTTSFSYPPSLQRLFHFLASSHLLELVFNQILHFTFFLKGWKNRKEKQKKEIDTPMLLVRLSTALWFSPQILTKGPNGEKKCTQHPVDPLPDGMAEPSDDRNEPLGCYFFFVVWFQHEPLFNDSIL